MDLLIVGNTPNDGTLVAEIDGYRLYHRESRDCDVWTCFKLIAKPGTRLQKGNYWLRWNKSDHYFSGGRDIQILDGKHPEVAKRLRSIISKRYAA